MKFKKGDRVKFKSDSLWKRFNDYVGTVKGYNREGDILFVAVEFDDYTDGRSFLRDFDINGNKLKCKPGHGVFFEEIYFETFPPYQFEQLDVL